MPKKKTARSFPKIFVSWCTSLHLPTALKSKSWLLKTATSKWRTFLSGSARCQCELGNGYFLLENGSGMFKTDLNKSMFFLP